MGVLGQKTFPAGVGYKPGGYDSLNIATSATRPYGADTKGIGSLAALRLLEKKIALEAVPRSIFGEIASARKYRSDQVLNVTNSIVVTIKPENPGANSVILRYFSPIAGIGIAGTGDVSGYEKDIFMKYQDIFYNDNFNGVVFSGFGREYNLNDMLGLIEQIEPALKNWVLEDIDFQCQQALVERYSYPLQGTGLSLVPSYNPNAYIVGVGSVTYNKTPATYIANINNQIANQTAGKGILTVSKLIDIEKLAKGLMVEPLQAGDYDFVLYIPVRQYYNLLKDSDFKEAVIRGEHLSPEVRRLPDIVGKYGRMLIVANYRHPTWTVTGGGTSCSIGYWQPGNIDGRDKTITPTTGCELGYLLGNMAVINCEANPLKIRVDSESYEKIRAKGVFFEHGYQIGNCPSLDNGEDVVNRGSILLFFSPEDVA